MPNIKSIIIDGKEISELIIGNKIWTANTNIVEEGTEVTLDGTKIVLPGVTNIIPNSFSIYGNSVWTPISGTSKIAKITHVTIPTLNVGKEDGVTLNSRIIPFELKGINKFKDKLVVNSDGTGKLIRYIDTIRLENQSFHINNAVRNFCSVNAGYPYLWFYFSTGNIYQNSARPSENTFMAMSLSEHFKSTTRRSIDTFYGSVDNFIGECIFGENIIISKERLGLSTDSNLNADDCKFAFAYWLITNGVTSYCPLLTPVETELSAQEVDNILPTLYKPTTVIWNNYNAQMEITYMSNVTAVTNALEHEYLDSLEETK